MKRILFAMILCIFLFTACNQASNDIESDIEPANNTLPNETLEPTDDSISSIIPPQEPKTIIESESEPTPEPEPELIIPIENPDVRGVKWGMTKEEIMLYESLELSNDDGDSIWYNDKIKTLDVSLAYEFKDNELIGVYYLVITRHTSSNQYYYDYIMLKNYLIEEHGEPIKDREIWIDDFYKGNANNIGMAIIKGDVSFLTEWESEKNQVSLFLAGDNFDIRGFGFVIKPIEA